MNYLKIIRKKRILKMIFQFNITNKTCTICKKEKENLRIFCGFGLVCKECIQQKIKNDKNDQKRKEKK